MSLQTGGLLVFSDIWSDFIVYIAISQYHFLTDSAGRYLFCELCQPWHSMHHSLPPVRKCSNVRDPYERPHFWLCRTAVTSLHFITKSGAASLPEDSRMWMIWGGICLVCVSWSGTERYWRWHWPVAQSSPCLHSNHRRTFWIFTWHKLAKTLLTVEIKLKFIVIRDICFRLPVVSGHLHCTR